MSYKINQNCIGCTLCAKNCPVDAIEGNLKQIHAINKDRCIECGVCANFCSKGAVEDENLNILPRLPKNQWKKPVVDKSLCTACGMCMDICASKSIKISYPQYKGDLDVFAFLENEKTCVACNMCENICPLKAITMKEVQHEIT